MDNDDEPPAPSSSVVETVGVVTVVIASAGLMGSVSVYATGNEAAFFGAVAALMLGTTGVGLMAAGRGIAQRRDQDSARR